MLQWSTNLACVPPVSPLTPQAQCFVYDYANSLAYDLSQLIRVNSNWVAIDDNETYFYTYSFNPCMPLVPTPAAMGSCAGGSACQSLRNPPGGVNVYANLGQASAPQIIDGAIVMVLTNV